MKCAVTRKLNVIIVNKEQKIIISEMCALLFCNHLLRNIKTLVLNPYY
jgi:hypothetical protein